MPDPVAILAGTGGRLALDLARRGMNVVLVGTDAAAVGLAVDLVHSTGSRAAGFVGDPAEDLVRQGVVELALELFGRIDLVGDAGGGAEAVSGLATAAATAARHPIEIASGAPDPRPGRDDPGMAG